MKMKMVIAGLILCIGILPAIGKITISFPQSLKGDWRPVPKGYNYCPTSADKNLHGDLIDIGLRLRAPKSFKGISADGWMCHAARWITTCDFRWYGPKYITHSIHSFRPSNDQCKEAIRLTNEGNWINPGFPPQSCGYASVTDSESVVVTVTKHQVLVDEYSGSWIDSQFPGGSCTSPICDTVHNSTLWHADHTLDSICDQEFVAMDAVLFTESGKFEEFGKPNSGIRSNYFPYESLKDVCQMDFCKRKGFKLPSGVWFEIEDAEKSHKAQVELKIKRCPHGAVISAPNQNAADINLIMDVERILDYSLCQATWSKIQNKEALTPIDISYLGPKNPGPGPAFTIINGTLHYFNTRYIRVDIAGPVTKEITGFVSGTSTSRVLWDQWFPYGENSIGPNGLLKTASGYKYPLFMVGTGVLDADIHKLGEATVIEHPHAKEAQKVVDDSEVIFFGDTGVSKNPVEVVEGWFSGWRSSLMSIFGIILLIVCLVLIVRILIALKYCCVRHKKRTIYKEDLEMGRIPRRA
ncbi:glycoprotein [Carajas virus]|uniref:Glycoprotein n=1 Tax=Carajas virus TaxID=239239 RepID=A0A0D3R1Y6_9RHAB|nr:glycoprotein [Carajas virus]AJR28527.1 glycoprotein [Carajas virus]